MADRKFLDRLTQNTKGFREGLVEQRNALEKLKGVGDILAELTDETDPISEVITTALESVDSMAAVLEKLEKLKLPGE